MVELVGQEFHVEEDYCKDLQVVNKEFLDANYEADLLVEVHIYLKALVKDQEQQLKKVQISNHLDLNFIIQEPVERHFQEEEDVEEVLEVQLLMASDQEVYYLEEEVVLLKEVYLLISINLQQGSSNQVAVLCRDHRARMMMEVLVQPLYFESMGLHFYSGSILTLYYYHLSNLE